jgi:hypothetical protein
MKHLGWIFVAIACYTSQDLWNAECRVACQRAGYDQGFYQESYCYCVDLKPYVKLVGKQTTLPKKAVKASSSSLTD